MINACIKGNKSPVSTLRFQGTIEKLEPKLEGKNKSFRTEINTIENRKTIKD